MTTACGVQGVLAGIIGLSKRSMNYALFSLLILCESRYLSFIFMFINDKKISTTTPTAKKSAMHHAHSLPPVSVPTGGVDVLDPGIDFVDCTRTRRGFGAFLAQHLLRTL